MTGFLAYRVVAILKKFAVINGELFYDAYVSRAFFYFNEITLISLEGFTAYLMELGECEKRLFPSSEMKNPEDFFPSQGEVSPRAGLSSRGLALLPSLQWL